MFGLFPRHDPKQMKTDVKLATAIAGVASIAIYKFFPSLGGLADLMIAGVLGGLGYVTPAPDHKTEAN